MQLDIFWYDFELFEQEKRKKKLFQKTAKKQFFFDFLDFQAICTIDFKNL
jgi:hypothetical protein